MRTIESISLFEGGRDGYHTYRIPALLTAANGDLLAFCEGRRDGAGDSGRIDLLMKSSSDDGRTWSDQRVVVSEPGMTCGNPCPVVVRETGRILMPFCKNRADGGEALIKTGNAPRTVWITQSDDHGRTWSPPEEITPHVKKNVWTWYATGPGHAIQLTSGRIVVPCDHNTGIRLDESDPFGSHLIYSDDHGATWRIGAVLSLPGNESCALECDDGELYLNCRTRSEYGVRSYGRSRDAGLSFSEEGFHHGLPEPRRGHGGCQGSLLKLPAQNGGTSRFVFCNPATTGDERKRLALSTSDDHGRSWQERLVVCEGPSAYSDLVLLSDGEIGCLYECGDTRYNERLAFARIAVSEIAHAPRPRGRSRARGPDGR